ncbi:MAG: DNA-binding protein [Bacteroidetes bacterium GWF2_43_63]|nr:MAG: DNA-binding protein [Bacteroidetes bacterium GWE2_42_42]OFY53863.1 MAG: DNA-binding protein [Bacteroidetes bacterium GWF2_43_63]HBG69821.1 DNA-binding protein [Bacteroidales bacterium]HCB60982.1 DNA-binding protein [Bacteroidales bacterium]HCY24538.1 DNA-binding protein [Bacteroidales bacterium]
MNSKNEIVIYQVNDSLIKIEVNIADETIWLSQQQIVKLFDSSKANISEHIKNIFLSGELDEMSVVRNFRTTATDGKSYNIKHYNLDVIISVGYRVNSIRGTQFRIWANSILKDYLLKGYSINNRMNRIEDHVFALTERIDRIDLQVNTGAIPPQGVFFNGQIFDAYTFVADIIRSAKKSITLIDNYVDDSVLVLLEKRNKGVSVCIYTKNISKQLRLDLEKHNAQYPAIEISLFHDAHDRFLLIDDSELFHIGASLKDLGKKWFAFSKIVDKEMIDNLRMRL